VLQKRSLVLGLVAGYDEKSMIADMFDILWILLKCVCVPVVSYRPAEVDEGTAAINTAWAD